MHAAADLGIERQISDGHVVGNLVGTGEGSRANDAADLKLNVDSALKVASGHMAVAGQAMAPG